MAGLQTGVDLKDATQVKEYLGNLGIEYRYGCYREKDPKSCHLLADYLESIGKDPAKSRMVYEANCMENSYNESCFKAGIHNLKGTGTAVNGDEALKYFTKACEAGHGKSCVYGGIVEFSGSRHTNRNKSDLNNGVELIRKGCEAKDGEGCFRYSTLFIQGVKEVLEKNMEKALHYGVKSCEYGIPEACINVSRMYKMGDGITANEEKAAEYMDIAQKLIRKRGDEHLQKQKTIKSTK